METFWYKDRKISLKERCIAVEEKLVLTLFMLIYEARTHKAQ